MEHPRLLITGGAGFIGINAADYFLRLGWSVTILDNLSRKGGVSNLQWLKGRHRNGLSFVKADVVTNRARLERAAANADAILHLAGQVAVTTSVQDPHADFHANALGTLNMLEAARKSRKRPVFIFASTNKVYGGMEAAKVMRTPAGYRYRDFKAGIPESFPLDFHSPYGCSKGAADQYVRDYSRIYGLRTVVFRQSCIYGPRQFGVEDQGWVAWFSIAAVTGKSITIYGDGYQVRDVLHVEDLCRAYRAAIVRADRLAGAVFNIGGGPANLLSLRETLGHLGRELKQEIAASYSGWRPGDQRIYVSDIRAAQKALRWTPRIRVSRGVAGLIRWVQQNRGLFQSNV